MEYHLQQQPASQEIDVLINNSASSGVVIMELEGDAMYSALRSCCFIPPPSVLPDAVVGVMNVEGGKWVSLANDAKVVTPDVQYIILRTSPSALSKSYEAYVGSGATRYPVAHLSNEQVAASLPSIGNPASCPWLAGMTARQVLQLNAQTLWSKLTFQCNTEKPIMNYAEIDEGGATVSVESASPEPTDPSQLLWQERSSIGNGIDGITLTYALLGKQAEDERLLFMAGAAVGISGAFLPLGLEPFVKSGFRRRKRRKDRDDASTNAGLVKAVRRVPGTFNASGTPSNISAYARVTRSHRRR